LQRVSGGQMRLEIVPGGTLGNIPQLWAQLRAGSLDMHLADMAAISALREASAFRITNMPYLFRDQDHYMRFLGSDVFSELMGEVERNASIHYLGYLDHRPPRALSTGNRPVRNMEDMRGLKVRTPEIGPITQAFRAFGASPTPVRGAELYTALQTGLVDGQDNGIVDVVAAGYVEVQRYYSPIDYLHSGIGVWVSQKRWQSLDARQQAWLSQAQQATGEQLTKAFALSVDKAVQQAKDKGMQFLDVDRSGFQAVGARLIDERDGQDWPQGLAQRIRDLK